MKFTKTLPLFLVVTTFWTSPLRLHAMMERIRENGGEEKKSSDTPSRTEANSRNAALQAYKETSTASEDVGSISLNGDNTDSSFSAVAYIPSTAVAEENINAYLEEEIKDINGTEDVQRKIEELRELYLETQKQADALGERYEKTFYQRASNSFKEAAESLEEAMMAHNRGKAEDREPWERVSLLMKESAEQWRETAPMWMNKKNEREEAQINKLIIAAWRKNIEGKSIKYRLKIKEAEESAASNAAELAQQWYQAAALQERSSEFFRNAAEVYALGTPEKNNEGENLNNAGLGFYLAAESLEKAIEAEENQRSNVVDSSENEQKALRWHEIAQQNQISGEAFANAAIAHAIGTRKQRGASASWMSRGNSASLAAKQLVKAIELEALWHKVEIKLWSQRTKKKRDIATAAKWRDTAAQSKIASEIFANVATDYLVKNSFNKGRDYWRAAAEATLCAAEQLENAINAEESIEVPSTEPQLWRKAARYYQISSEAFTQAAITSAITSIFSREVHDWLGRGASFYSAAEGQRMVIQANKIRNIANARSLEQAVYRLEQAGEKYKQAGEIRLEGDHAGAERLHSEADIITKESNSLITNRARSFRSNF